MKSKEEEDKIMRQAQQENRKKRRELQEYKNTMVRKIMFFTFF